MVTSDVLAVHSSGLYGPAGRPPVAGAGADAAARVASPPESSADTADDVNIDDLLPKN